MIRPQPKPSSDCEKVCVAGISIANVTETEALARIEKMIETGEPHYMVVVNAAKTVAAHRDPDLRNIVARADLVTADGMSVIWASKFLRKPLKQRVTGIDLMAHLIGRAEEAGWSIFFLGARDETVRELATRISAQHPRLRIAGWQNGYFPLKESPKIAAQISNTRADVLFVAMGSPAQEKWISKNIDRTGVKFALGVGGAFDHLSGIAKRAPLWMQRAGLEWMYRLVREPRRLWKRYLVGNTMFLYLVLSRQLRPERPAPDIRHD
jgi:N-acetylglucosaminyldiphosphoundecaprenol N-acetyl-beta-D-mannosaminyltransferase